MTRDFISVCTVTVDSGQEAEVIISEKCQKKYFCRAYEFVPADLANRFDRAFSFKLTLDNHGSVYVRHNSPIPISKSQIKSVNYTQELDKGLRDIFE